jgi:nucleoside-diphosphate-sugar epimerase
MTLRGARILLVGACSHAGSTLVEAFLALGAHVVAADRLRTRLEELRARMRQHERLWVAEADASDAGAAALLADVARDEPIDAALLVLPDEPRPAGLAGAPLVPAPEAFAQAHCRSFLDAALEAMARGRCGRVLVLVEAGAAGSAAGAIVQLVRDGDERARTHGGELAVGGTLAGGADRWLEAVVALADPKRPPLRGFEALAAQVEQARPR